MHAFELTELIAQHGLTKRLYYEFLRVPSMSMGLYVLPANGIDPQNPHNEDEVYYVVAGQGMIEIEGHSRPVQSGSIVYVKAHDQHRFHSITEDLTIVVFFAPAETGA